MSPLSFRAVTASPGGLIRSRLGRVALRLCDILHVQHLLAFKLTEKCFRNVNVGIALA